MLTPEQQRELYIVPRNGMTGSKRWPNNLVLYKLDNKFKKKQKQLIENAMKIIEKGSCIKFQQRVNESAYIQFIVSALNCYVFLCIF